MWRQLTLFTVCSLAYYYYPIADQLSWLPCHPSHLAHGLVLLTLTPAVPTTDT